MINTGILTINIGNFKVNNFSRMSLLQYNIFQYYVIYIYIYFFFFLRILIITAGKNSWQLIIVERVSFSREPCCKKYAIFYLGLYLGKNLLYFIGIL